MFVLTFTNGVCSHQVWNLSELYYICEQQIM